MWKTHGRKILFVDTEACMGRNKQLTLDIFEDVEPYSLVEDEILGTPSWYTNEITMDVSYRDVGLYSDRR